jgi:hypothetical protein
MPGAISLLVATRKGAFFLDSDARRARWTLRGPALLGHIVHHAVQDPREPRRFLMAARAGHLGPTLYLSTNAGRGWKEASRPPAFPPADNGRSVAHTFWLTPGHASQKGVWWAGTSPPGLFRSEDGGDTWHSVRGFNEHPDISKWLPGPQESPPDGATLHSINVDPRDPRHLYIGISSGGVFESLDAGASWTPLNKGCDAESIPTPDPEYGHDPHCVRLHPLMPGRLYQQNHCGIYRIDRSPDPALDRWVRIGRSMPKKTGDIGFPIELHPRNPDAAWVFPMDGASVWPRTSPGGKPAVYMTRNAGRTWVRLDEGLPKEQAWFTVKRQAMAVDWLDPCGVYFGTTSGEVWASRNEGARWRQIAAHLPHIYAVETARL